MIKKNIIIFSLLFLVVLTFTSSAYASEYNSKAQEIVKNSTYTYNEYFTLKQTNGLITLVVFSSNTYDFPSNSKDFLYISEGSQSMTFLYPGQQYDVFIYYLNDSGFYLTDNLTVTSSTWQQIFAIDEFYDSTFNVIKGNDELFFPVTPALTVEQMLAEEVPIMADKVVRTMWILLLCGVGCLALLISLPVLSRVFSIFQVK